ncbi:MAG: hypothetical protein EXS55_01505 [Candidatus Magasanikbacteria bacterium]|nr:hypothetical protein [Candidatus Magasanikbacteria bacterium]
MKKYFAEGLGTFLLSFVVIASLHGTFPVSTPLLAGLTLGLMVYVIGSISGAHINPAVTVGIWSIGKIKTPEAIKYIFAQFIGAGVALYLGRYLGWETTLSVANTARVIFAEFIGTAFFTLGIAAVVLGKVPTDVHGVVIGGSLLLGLSLAALGSNAVLNPAVALGIGSFSWSYVVAPIIGSVAGMNVFRWLVHE